MTANCLPGKKPRCIDAEGGFIPALMALPFFVGFMAAISLA